MRRDFLKDKKLRSTNRCLGHARSLSDQYRSRDRFLPPPSSPRPVASRLFHAYVVLPSSRRTSLVLTRWPGRISGWQQHSSSCLFDGTGAQGLICILGVLIDRVVVPKVVSCACFFEDVPNSLALDSG